VLADVMMPGLDGFELLRRLRADVTTRGIPIILLSARAGEESRVEGVEAGADDYLVKPFSARELVARVGTHLRLAHERREAARAVEEREQRLRKLLGEREMLLKEVHHRVKNNLEVIDSLLQLQANAFPDPRLRAALADTSGRVHAISEVHRQLYASPDLAQVDMKAYAQMLSASVCDIFSLADRVRGSVAGDAVLLDIRRAAPAGLILNELLSNALKHAFPGRRAGAVAVTLATDGAAIEMGVCDDGVGLPEQRGPGSLGLELVRVLTEQLRGTVTFEHRNGTSVRVRFPAQPTVSS
jgi:two-component sensor histidine kinase